MALRARRLIEGWPEGGLVVGILPAGTRPLRSGRAVVDMARAAADHRGPPRQLDLAPGATDHAPPYGTEGAPGFAELAAGEAELWDVLYPEEGRRVLYIPCGRGLPGADLAGSRRAVGLARHVRRKERLMLMLLDGAGAEAAVSSGCVNGVVRLGEGAPTPSPRRPAIAEDDRPWEESRPPGPDRQPAASDAADPGQASTRSGGRRRRYRLRRGWRRLRRRLLRTLAVLSALVLTVILSMLAPAVLDGHGGWTLADSAQVIVQGWQFLFGPSGF